MATQPHSTSEPDGVVTVGRRASARLRLAIPARLVSLYGTQPCIMLDISRTGARMALGAPLAVGQSGFIALARFELFGLIVRTERGSGGGGNAMAFDDPLSKAQILEIRQFAERFEAREQEDLREQVRKWVTGEK